MENEDPAARYRRLHEWANRARRQAIIHEINGDPEAAIAARERERSYRVEMARIGLAIARERREEDGDGLQKAPAGDRG